MSTFPSFFAVFVFDLQPPPFRCTQTANATTDRPTSDPDLSIKQPRRAQEKKTGSIAQKLTNNWVSVTYLVLLFRLNLAHPKQHYCWGNENTPSRIQTLLWLTKI